MHVAERDVLRRRGQARGGHAVRLADVQLALGAVDPRDARVVDEDVGGEDVHGAGLERRGGGAQDLGDAVGVRADPVFLQAHDRGGIDVAALGDERH